MAASSDRGSGRDKIRDSTRGGGAEPGSVFGPPPGRTLGRVLLVLGLAIHLLYLISLRTHWLDRLFLEAGGGNRQACDFFGIYQAGDNLILGRSIYSLEGRPEGSPRRVPYFYFYRYLPPTAYLAGISALLMGPWLAYWLWVFTTEVMLGLLLFSLSRERSPPAPLLTALIGIALGFSPFYLEQWMGQFSFLMAFFLWGTFRSEIRASRAVDPGNRPAPGTSQERGLTATPLEKPEESARGFLRRSDFWCWSASIALKNYPALFALPLLRWRHWRRVVLAAAAVTLVCLPYYLLQPHDLLQFVILNFRRVSAQILAGSYGLANFTRALSWHLPSSWTGQMVSIGSLHVYAGNIPMVGCAVVVGLLSALVTWRMKRTAVAEVMALWVLTFFLTYKDVWEYHYVMLLPVIWILATRGDWRWPLVLGVLLALPTPYIFYRDFLAGRPVEQWPLGIVIVHFGSKVFPVIGLYLIAARRSLPPLVRPVSKFQGVGG